MEAVETVQAQAQEVAASHKAACGAFFNDIEVLSATASDYLALLSKHAAVADAQKLRTAALKMRLSQLAKDRRSREAAVAAIVEAKQRELDRLLQEEREEQKQEASAATIEPSLSTPVPSPDSRTG